MARRSRIRWFRTQGRIPTRIVQHKLCERHDEFNPLFIRTPTKQNVVLDSVHIVCDSLTEEILSDASLLEKHGLAPAPHVSKSQV